MGVIERKKGTKHKLLHPPKLYNNEVKAHLQCKSIQNMTIASISDTYEIDARHAQKKDLSKYSNSK